MNAEGEWPAALLFHFVTARFQTLQLPMNSAAFPSPQPPQPTHNTDALASECLTFGQSGSEQLSGSGHSVSGLL